jgi:hypothetical protein
MAAVCYHKAAGDLLHGVFYLRFPARGFPATGGTIAAAIATITLMQGGRITTIFPSASFFNGKKMPGFSISPSEPSQKPRFLGHTPCMLSQKTTAF